MWSVFGQDVGYFGGVFRCTDGLQRKYGSGRCFDTPISETGIVGVAVGMAANGLRPVSEIQFADYMYPAYDQIVSEAARLRYRSAGEFSAPLVVRMPCGGGIYGGQTDSQSPEALFTHVAGLKTVVPSNPFDAKGLLIAAIEDDDPVIFLEPNASTTARLTGAMIDLLCLGPSMNSVKLRTAITRPQSAKRQFAGKAPPSRCWRMGRWCMYALPPLKRRESTLKSSISELWRLWIWTRS